MKTILINGCNDNNIIAEKTIKKLQESLSKKGADYTLNTLSKLNLKNCTACDSCQSVKPGLCAVNDGLNDILKQYLNSDTTVIITPIEFGSCNSTTKHFIDRTEPLFLPYQTTKNGQTVMKSRYNNHPDIMFIGISADSNVDSINNFKDTFANCTLSLSASNKVIVKIIEKESDVDSFNFL